MREIDLSRPLPYTRYVKNTVVNADYPDLIPTGYVARIRKIVGYGTSGLTPVVYVYDRFNNKVKAMMTLKEVVSQYYVFPNADTFESGFISPQDTIKVVGENGFTLALQFDLYRAW